MKLSNELKNRYVNDVKIWDGYTQFIFSQYGNDNKPSIVNDLREAFKTEYRTVKAYYDCNFGGRYLVECK